MIAFYKTEDEILFVIDGFKSKTLPADRWTHPAHLVTALWFNRNYTPFEAICYLRSGIITYNSSTGGENTPARGYHETLTLFWCRIVRDFASANTHLSFLELCNAFLNSRWASKELPFMYYSKDRLFSTEARATWVSPDLQSW